MTVETAEKGVRPLIQHGSLCTGKGYIQVWTRGLTPFSAISVRDSASHKPEAQAKDTPRSLAPRLVSCKIMHVHMVSCATHPAAKEVIDAPGALGAIRMGEDA